MKIINLEELKKFNGKNGNKAYIAYKGGIYDVTESFLWKGGKHQVTHYAGTDLTGKLQKAPHRIESLEKFPIIGKLKKNL